jgi:hypothetical protein
VYLHPLRWIPLCPDSIEHDLVIEEGSTFTVHGLLHDGVGCGRNIDGMRPQLHRPTPCPTIPWRRGSTVLSWSPLYIESLLYTQRDCH